MKLVVILKLLLTACKQYCLAAGATQGYDRLHANRYGQVKENKFGSRQADHL